MRRNAGKKSLDDVSYPFDINDYSIDALYEILGDHDRLAAYIGESQAVEPCERVIILKDDPTVENDARLNRKPRTPLMLDFPADFFLADYRHEGPRQFDIRQELADDDKREAGHEGGEKKYYQNAPLVHVDCRMIGSAADLLREHDDILKAYLKLPGEYKIVIGGLLWSLKNRMKNHILFSNVKIMDDETLSPEERQRRFAELSEECNAKWDAMIAALDIARLREIIDNFHLDRPCQARFIDAFTKVQLLEYHEQDETRATMLAEFINTIKRKRYAGLAVLRPFELREAMYNSMADECDHFVRLFSSQELRAATEDNLRALGAMSKLCRLAPLDDHNKETYSHCAADILRGYQSVVRLMPNPDDDCSRLLLTTIAPLVMSKCSDLVVVSGICERLRDINDNCIIMLDDDLAAASPALTAYIGQLQKIRSRYLWEKTKGDMDFTDVSLQDAEEIFEYSKTCALLHIETLKEIKQSEDIVALQKLIDDSDREGDPPSTKSIIMNDESLSDKEKAFKLVNLARTIRRLPAIAAEVDFQDGKAKERFRAFIKAPITKINEQEARAFWAELIEHQAPRKMINAMGFLVEVLETLNNHKLSLADKQAMLIYLLQQYAVESSFKINLNGCNFDGCNLQSRRAFSSINRNGLNLSNVSMLDASICYCTLTNIECEEGNFSKSQFVQCTLDHGQFRHCYLVGVQFTDSKLCEASFSNVSMIDSVLTGCDFTLTRFTDCSLARCIISNSTFDQVNLMRCDLSAIKLRNIVFTNATLNNVNLCHADLSGASFIDCKMLNVTLINPDEKINFERLSDMLNEWHQCGIPLQVVYENLEANLNNPANNYSPAERHAILLVMREHAYFSMPNIEYSPTLFNRLQKSADVNEAIRAKVETMFQQVTDKLRLE